MQLLKSMDVDSTVNLEGGDRVELSQNASKVGERAGKFAHNTRTVVGILLAEIRFVAICVALLFQTAVNSAVKKKKFGSQNVR